VNVSVAGLTVSVEGGAVTLSVTGMFTGPAAPVTVTTTDAL
jgi:hypothetical protein